VKKKVLLLDDARSIRIVFKKIIEEAGYVALIASNAQEALQMLHDGSTPDLIVSDLNMPGLNGIQFSKLALEMLPECPILIMSNESDKKLVQEAIAVGVSGWMLKPVDREVFVSKLHKFLEEEDTKP
jgi:CheY-like chemotaxis protein